MVWCSAFGAWCSVMGRTDGRSEPGWRDCRARRTSSGASAPQRWRFNGFHGRHPVTSRAFLPSSPAQKPVDQLDDVLVTAHADVQVAQLHLGVRHVHAAPLHAIVVSPDVFLADDAIVRSGHQVDPNAEVSEIAVPGRHVRRGVRPVVTAVQFLPAVVVQFELLPSDELYQMGAGVDGDGRHGLGGVVRHLQGPVPVAAVAIDQETEQ
mmetsp:Transcript_4947/g.14336  ORF Transcript_4947/g.14336 Transcript_4947/m.14336 type:complete len:208 (-) Transcript_4947:984-1607(-)